MKRIEGRIEKLETKFGVHTPDFQIVVLQGTKEEQAKLKAEANRNYKEGDYLIFIQGIKPNGEISYSSPTTDDL